MTSTATTINQTALLEQVRRQLEAAGLTASQQLDFYEAARAQTAQRLEIHESKMTNGTQGERVACNALKLTWNKDSVHGVDGWNSKGEGIELKCFKKAAKRANINYKVPERKPDEGVAVWANRVRQHYTKTVPGGHYWVLLSGASTKYETSWHIPAISFATAMYAWCLSNPNGKTINLGAAYCKTCKLPHRVMEIHKILNDVRWIGHGWQFPKFVPAQCPKEAAKAT